MCNLDVKCAMSEAAHSPPSKTSLGSMHLSICSLFCLVSLLDAKSIPSTPSTACGSICSMATPATSSNSGLASSVWSQSSGGKTSQTSPASSTSSTATELDEGSTQLEPKAGDVSVAVEDNDNHLAKPGRGGSAASYAAGTPGSRHFQSCGAKRLREQTSCAPQLHRVQYDSSPISNPASDEQTLDERSAKARSSGPGNPGRKKKCLERSQHPRLDGKHTPGAGPRSHRTQLRNSGIEEESMPCARGDAPGGIFNTVVGSPEISSRKRRGQDNDERAEVEAAGNGGSDGPEQTLTENLPAQDRMDACEALAQGGSCYPTDQSDGDEMDFDGAEHEPFASGDNHGATSSGTEQRSPGTISGWLGGGGHSRQRRSDDLLPAIACGNRDGRFNEQSRNKLVVANAKVNEASALRDAGVTGDEDFTQLFRKLQRCLNWKWGGAISKLSNDFWICRTTPLPKTAEVGVDKFAKKEDVVKYVRRVLGLTGATLDNQDERSGEERDQDTEVDSEDDNGDGDKRDNNEAQGDVETSTASKQRGALLSTPNGRALQAALEALNPSNAPGVLQQRTTEFDQVLRFVTNSVERASGGSLYLCGVPGTGKTQTMAHVQAKVQKMYAKVSKGAVAIMCN